MQFMVTTSNELSTLEQGACFNHVRFSNILWSYKIFTQILYAIKGKLALLKCNQSEIGIHYPSAERISEVCEMGGRQIAVYVMDYVQ